MINTIDSRVGHGNHSCLFVSIRGSKFPPYPLRLCAFAFLFFIGMLGKTNANDLATEYPDFYSSSAKTKGADFIQAVTVLAPEYCSFVKGDVTVVFRAPGMTRVSVRCWRQPTPERPAPDGHDALVAELTPAPADGSGSFLFPADDFPAGPLTIRIHAKDAANRQDICELQLFNLGGVPFKQGIPSAAPPAARGMRLVFADDFDAPLSISPDGMGARYAAHKTGGGDFSGWPFSDPAGPDQPFSQHGTYLRIHASKPHGTKGRTGILSSLRPDGTGVCVPVPSYFECRFVAQSAPGTWPAFWTLTKGTTGMDKRDPLYADLSKAGSDELDIIEAYGGYGPKHPNSGGIYHSVTHFWNQEPPAWYKKKLADGSTNPNHTEHNFRTDTLTLGGRSSWSWTPHTYGLAVTETDTVYYFDDIEIGRHPTGSVSLAQPAWFLINYAIGGISGWPIDLERYKNKSDMWVDFVRVYSGRAQQPALKPGGFAGAAPVDVAVTCATEGAVVRYTLDGSDPTDASPLAGAAIAVPAPSTVKARAFVPGLLASPVAACAVTAPPGIPGSIGINFLSEDTPAQRLTGTDVAGADPYAQANWNNVRADLVPAPALITSDGTPVSGIHLVIPVRAGLVPAPATGESWGFTDGDLTLKRGALLPAPRIDIAGIPHARYRVIVYLTASHNRGTGTVTLSKFAEASGTVPPPATYAYDYTWLNGAHVRASPASAPGSAPAPASMAVFDDVTATNVSITLTPTGGGWTGIAAIQIIPSPGKIGD